jgi:hypothetical protein
VLQGLLETLEIKLYTRRVVPDVSKKPQAFGRVIHERPKPYILQAAFKAYMDTFHALGFEHEGF